MNRVTCVSNCIYLDCPLKMSHLLVPIAILSMCNVASLAICWQSSSVNFILRDDIRLCN